ncbi:src-like-adapter 2 isoform X3 [Ursus maritimus]|uniref:Src-like-adapter 2 isoform X3 n=1 Tax=Ursus maritimus TaxID=29073 RepID=A0A8M1GHH9_URSMA|nr:src-like-adapter 2 isoform X3 [Ursus maritimus]
MGGQPSRGKTLPSPSSSPSVQEPGPVPMQAERSRAMAVALGNFPVGEHIELSLRLGDPLTIVSEDGDWWTVMSEVSGTEYSVPSSHVAKISHGWLYEGLSREKAEELLLLPGNSGGAFLIRESQTRRGCYSLSVRLSRPASWDRIRHYRIQRLDNGWLYISPRLTFPSLQALVDHYSGTLCPAEDGPTPWQVHTSTCDCAEGATQLERAGQVRGPLEHEGRTKELEGPIPGNPRPQMSLSSLGTLESHSLLFSEAPALGESPLLSEGLREAISSYISLTDGSSLDDAMAQSRGQEGMQRYST